MIEITDSFTWLDIFTIGGWPFWMVLSLNSILISVITNRSWYLLGFTKTRLKLVKTKDQKIKLQNKKHDLLASEKTKINAIVLLEKYLIITCILIGIIGSLINLLDVVSTYQLTIFLQQTMWLWLVIKIAIPFFASLFIALTGIIFFIFYVKFLNKITDNYQKNN